jgi:hypothetical protein
MLYKYFGFGFTGDLTSSKDIFLLMYDDEALTVTVTKSKYIVCYCRLDKQSLFFNSFEY